jgi:SAM-dependent methyltransferase
MDILAHNRKAWDRQSRHETSPWVKPVSANVIHAAREGKWSVILTPNKPVPKSWFGDLADTEVLALASGGGQQVPILAAAGARVTSFDNSPVQLEKDRQVAAREDLEIRYEPGDMADLSRFDDSSFDLIFHPVSNLFVQDIEPVWQECIRVLRPGGRLLAGFMNPCIFLFDLDSIEAGNAMEVAFKLPYSDIGSLSETELKARISAGEAMEFSHTLTDQIGGQLAAGFCLAGFYEDTWSNADFPLNTYMNSSIATLAIKPT